MADAPPPPLHILASPYFALFYFKMCTRLRTILAPLIPIGCPKATAPPLTFIFSSPISSSFILARAVAENASLTSKKSIC